MKQLRKFARLVGEPVLVLHDDESTDLLATLEADWEVHPVGGPLPDQQRWAGVALVVADRGSLRRVAGVVPRLGRTRAIACLLTDENTPPYLAPRPDWPPVTRLASRRLVTGGALTVLRLEAAMPAHLVLRELARMSGTSQPDPGRIVLATPGLRRRFTLPPQIVVMADRRLPVQEYDPRVAPAPAVVADPALARGPLDEGVINPIGFHSEPEHGIAVLEGAEEVSARTVIALRSYQGVRVSWAEPTPDLARTVAALAMAGIPLLGDPPPPDMRDWLGQSLADALSWDVDVTDPLRREEHSIRLRRAALLLHSGPGWRARVTEAAGGTATRLRSCSVVLATRRPHQLDNALAQVARQQGVDLELVVAAHGFRPDVGQVRAQLPGRTVDVVSLPADALFGDVLNAGVNASSGEIVVKMDDDDFYGPHFLLDLLLAREYSGADIVGTPAEFVYLEDLDRTVRRHGTRRDASERFAGLVAGGTISVPREVLAAVGGFQPVRRFVDHQLLHAARAAGATVYRTHGLGFMLRRSSGGHTWQAGDDHFLDTDRLRQEWDGFVPTRILEPDDDGAR